MWFAEKSTPGRARAGEAIASAARRTKAFVMLPPSNWRCRERLKRQDYIKQSISRKKKSRRRLIGCSRQGFPLPGFRYGVGVLLLPAGETANGPHSTAPIESMGFVQRARRCAPASASI